MVKLRFPSKEPYVGLVRLLASGIARQNKLDEDSVDDLKLAVNELTARLTEYRGVGDISISFSEAKDKLLINIVANGQVEKEMLFADSLIKEDTIALLVEGLDFDERKNELAISFLTRL